MKALHSRAERWLAGSAPIVLALAHASPAAAQWQAGHLSVAEQPSTTARKTLEYGFSAAALPRRRRSAAVSGVQPMG